MNFFSTTLSEVAFVAAEKRRWRFAKTTRQQDQWEVRELRREE